MNIKQKPDYLGKEMDTGESKNIDETDLIRKLLSNDRNAAKLFFEQYGGLIRHAVSSVNIKSDFVEHGDLFHGAIEHLFRDDMKAFKQFRGKCTLGSYIYTVCRRYALSVACREKHTSDWQSMDSLNDVLAQPEDEPDTEYGDEEKRILGDILQNSDNDTKILVKMIFLDARPTEEIMHFFGWGSVNTVYAMKNKIAAKLRKAVRKKLLTKVVNDAV